MMQKEKKQYITPLGLYCVTCYFSMIWRPSGASDNFRFWNLCILDFTVIPEALLLSLNFKTTNKKIFFTCSTNNGIIVKITFRMTRWLIGILLLTFNHANAQSIDSFNQFISLQFNARSLPVFNANNTYQSPFEKCAAYMVSVNVQKQLLSYKKFNLVGYAGISIQLMKIGEINAIQNSRQIHEPLNYTNLMLGISNGLAIERSILKFNNHNLILGAGFWSNGIFKNGIKQKTAVFDRNDQYGKDSIVINFEKCNSFFISPFYQLTLKTQLKKSCMITGIKYMFGNYNNDPNISYNFYLTKFPINPGKPANYYGTIGDNKPQITLFWGISF